MGISILILEDSSDLRTLMAKLLESKLGATCLQVASYRDLIDRASAVLVTELAILDINLENESESGLDAYDWLQSRSYKGRIVFLTGHAMSHPLVSKAVSKGARVLSKPISVNVLLQEMTFTRQLGVPSSTC